jgi:hypothetical protein
MACSLRDAQGVDPQPGQRVGQAMGVDRSPRSPGVERPVRGLEGAAAVYYQVLTNAGSPAQAYLIDMRLGR